MSPRSDPEDVAIPKPKYKTVSLRVPRWMFNTLREVVSNINEVEDRYPQLSRNEWIVQAINEKLRRDLEPFVGGGWDR